ncbi:FecR family protein [Steroidobacter sp.]|uniref:FecR family protein n=1 Tax=Steroidobacter sp. TaxID=1978227 RepID=UPI001A5E6343|nr:FecR domain-containing protein [Steroidobacter sp.]MBL8269085.1 FecR domain-containing protein [Steroidobacter sp.]
MQTREAAEEAAARWIARRELGPWGEAEQAQFTTWLNSSLSHRVEYLRLNATWSHSDRLKAIGAGVPPGTVPSREVLANIPFADRQVLASEAPAPQVGRRFSKSLTALAASVVLAMVTATMWLLPAGSTYKTQVGAIEAIPIADGSKITLNTDTRIRVTLSDEERRVSLNQGEAFFEVAKDPRRPFVVEAGQQTVTAVGTKFSVRRTGDDVQVVVTEGKVRVERAVDAGKAKAPVQLQVGAVAVASSTGVLVQEKSLPEAEEILSWRGGFLVLRGMLLSEAAAEFNRYNERKIVIADPSVAAMRIGGTFRAANVDAFTRLLHGAFPIDVEQRDDEIVLTARNIPKH